MEASYQELFATFLQHTNEKQRFIDYILKIIQNSEIESMLDIGPGDGRLSIPLAERVSEYKGVEQKPEYAENLSHQGLDVHHGSFPTELGRKFDLVLASHSVPYLQEDYKPFVEAAYDHVAPGGMLLLITFRGREDKNWEELLKCVEGDSQTVKEHRQWIEGFLDYLHQLGEWEVRQVCTAVETSTVGEMFNALGFVYSDAQDEKLLQWRENEETIRRYLREHYRKDRHQRNGEEYVFPFHHSLITVNKQAD